jgi:sulfatase maturation enzyme AslB (radical SAM superfamily)
MAEIKSIGFALDPNGIPAFLLDWEVTKKCNLDCSYCGTDVEYGGHNNDTNHPPLDECLKTIDFMYEYVSLYMTNKKPVQRKVVLNVYGGESLFHPNIVEILTAAREKYKPYADLWELTITTTTNAVINKSIWKKIVPLIDEFIVSYHAELRPKHEQLFFDNLIELQQQNKRFKSVVMMHNDPNLWEKSLATIEFLKNNNMKYLPKPVDIATKNWAYTEEQFNWMKKFWQVDTATTQEKTVSVCEGRACCGGRKLALNNELKSSVTFVQRQGFRGWYCSVNWFFLFVQQVTGNVYTNKDCRMGFNGRVDPLGNIAEYQKILDNLVIQFETKSMPVIQCAKSICLCGYCAPKAEQLDDFKDLISRHVVTDVITYE